MFTRRDMQMVLIIIVLWDLGKGAVRLWERKTWAVTQPGSLAHDTADLASIFT